MNERQIGDHRAVLASLRHWLMDNMHLGEVGTRCYSIKGGACALCRRFHIAYRGQENSLYQALSLRSTSSCCTECPLRLAQNPNNTVSYGCATATNYAKFVNYTAGPASSYTPANLWAALVPMLSDLAGAGLVLKPKGELEAVYKSLLHWIGDNNPDQLASTWKMGVGDCALCQYHDVHGCLACALDYIGQRCYNPDSAYHLVDSAGREVMLSGKDLHPDGKYPQAWRGMLLVLISAAEYILCSEEKPGLKFAEGKQSKTAVQLTEELLEAEAKAKIESEAKAARRKQALKSLPLSKAPIGAQVTGIPGWETMRFLALAFDLAGASGQVLVKWIENMQERTKVMLFCANDGSVQWRWPHEPEWRPLFLMRDEDIEEALK